MKIIKASSILPHRAPFLMIDNVTHFSGGDLPSLQAEKFVKQSDPAFNHFESPYTWPAVFLIEGAAQSAAMLMYLQTAKLHSGNKGSCSDKQKGIKQSEKERYKALWSLQEKPMNTGMLSMVDVHIHEAVFADCHLMYKVSLLNSFLGHSHFQIKVFSQDNLVLEGRIFGTNSNTTIEDHE